ncbi:CD1108 family mobile element protein [Blautia massiliensis (ex Liu et al. 2021)]|uniref:CD1108 family mobile element protein n=1 Tax=Blautia massiliensis (ex Liu et al. 2021) TaxID=3062492 RepID=UPI003F8BE383
MAKRSPRLLFTEEELEASELQKPIKKAEKAQKKLTKAESKIPKKKIVQKQRVYDPKENQVVTRLVFEGTEKKRPSKLTHAAAVTPLNAVSAVSHRELHEDSDGSVSASVSHEAISSAEGGIRTLDTAHRTLQDKPYARALKAERAADRANLKALYKEAELQNPEWGASPVSRFQQKRAIKKAYAEAKAGKAADNTVKASEAAAKAVKKTGEETSKAVQFVARHKKGFVILGVIGMMFLFVSAVMSSCSVMMSSLTSSGVLTTYPSADADMLAAEAQYLALEAELQEYLDNYESTHDYDEYHFDLDEIEHDPYVLISMLTALWEGEWTIDEVGGLLQTIFDRQYTLTEDVQVETRYRTETRTGYYTVTDPETGATSIEEYEYEVQVPYDYYICTVTLENFNLSHLPVYLMDQDHLSLYSYLETVATVECGGQVFTAKGKTVLTAGWKSYAAGEQKEKVLPPMTEGQSIDSFAVSLEEGKTKPPARYTEDTLLSAMETAGAKEMPDDAERKGLGTPATRAGILEKLVSSGFVERKKNKKAVSLVPQDIGISLITVLPEQLQSPLLTAEWENMLKEIERGELSSEAFMAQISRMVSELVCDYEPVSGAEVLFPSGRPVVGKCPRCGGPVTESKTGFFCERRDCRFGLWKDNRYLSAKHIILTKKMAEALLKDGRTFVSGMYSEKTGKSYSAYLVLTDDGQKSSYALEFDREKTGA